MHGRQSFCGRSEPYPSRARASVLAEVGAKLASAVDDRGLGFPIATNIAIARCQIGRYLIVEHWP